MSEYAWPVLNQFGRKWQFTVWEIEKDTAGRKYPLDVLNSEIPGPIAAENDSPNGEIPAGIIQD